MKILRIIFVLLAIAGAGALAYAVFVDGPSQWEPVTLPFPGAGYKVKAGFHVYRPATYAVRVTVPSGDNASPEGPPVACALRVRLSGQSFAAVDALIPSLRSGASYPWGSLVYFESDAGWRLAPGDYEIEISSEKAAELFTTRGAMLSLAQVEKPVETLLLSQLLRWGGAGLSGVGLLGSLICAFIKPRRKRMM